MTFANYTLGLEAFLDGYPGMLVDRGLEIDPSAMERDLLERVVAKPKTQITSGATFNATTLELKVSFTTKFLRSASGNYKLACVLIEDSVTGLHYKFNQQNKYSGGTYGPMGGFENLGNPVPSAFMVYDHVARSISPNFLGYANAFNATINSGDTFVHNFVFTLDPSWHTERLKIIGMVMGPAGQIDNGSSTSFSQSVLNGYREGTLILESATLPGPDATFIVYPNPSSGIFHIEFGEHSAYSSIQVYSMQGGLMHSIQNPEGHDYLLDTKTWSQGIYMLRWNDGDKLRNARLVKE